MNSQVELDKLINVISSANNIGIFTHKSPDGDAIGSALALYLGLKQLKKDVDIITDDYSRSFLFLSNLDKIQKEGAAKYQVCISLDCATRALLYDPTSSFDKADTTICIDHHASNQFYANINYVEDKSPAACKTLIKILKLLGITITKEIGEALMTGIITDTGGFRYETVDDETFEFAAQMLDVGVNISNIYLRTFDTQTKAQFKLTTIATSRLKFMSKGRIAVTYITLDDIKKTNAQIGDHEGIVNIGRNVEGVIVSIFLREDREGYKVSFRGNLDVDVSEIALIFGGGGHKKAAGCLIKSSLEEAIKKLVKATEQRL